MVASLSAREEVTADYADGADDKKAAAPLFPRELVQEVWEDLFGRFDPRPAWEWDGKSERALCCPHALCERLCPVGGFRRRKRQMKDLEILYIPRSAAVVDPGDLFGASRPVDVTELLIERMVSEGVLGKRLKVTGAVSAWGPENKHAVHVGSGVAIDLFAATEENWHNRMVVTTGPRELNVRIAQLAIDRGWEWEVYEAGFVPLGKTWATATQRERRTMRSEAMVFQFVGLECPPPEDRR